MNDQINPQETRALGWYAVRWMHITDWFKATKQRKAKSPGSNSDSGSAAADKTVSEQSDVPATKQQQATNKEAAKLKEITQESEGVLIKVKTVFPFTMFRDTLTIDRHKLTIVYKTFFLVEHTVSVPIENIKNIQANLGPFFGSLIITSDHFINNTQEINFLTRQDAEKIQKLIQGCMVAIKEQIDISKVDTKQLKKWLSELGEGRATEISA